MTPILNQTKFPRHPIPSESDLSSLLSKFKDKRVLVVGDLMADQFIYGETVRLSREAPVPVLHTEEVTYQPGAAANVARFVRSFGAEVTLCGVVGFDDAADHLHRQLSRRGIGTGGIYRSAHRPTILKVRVVAVPYGQQLLRIDYESTDRLHQDELASLKSIIKAFAPHKDVIIVADYDKGFYKGGEIAQIILEESQKAGSEVPVVVDAKTHHFRQFPQATLTIGHIQDALQHYRNEHEDQPTIEQLGDFLLANLNLEALLLNCDHRGLALFRKNEEPYLSDLSPDGIYDFMGAGDVLSTVVALSLACGADTKLATTVGCLSANVMVHQSGSGIDIAPEHLLAQARRLRDEYERSGN